MPNYDYKTDKKIADKSEAEFRDVLLKRYPKDIEFVRFNNDKKYDLVFNFKGKEATFEIKEDFTCEKTGNIGIEYASWGRDAGIATSQADFYGIKAHCPDGRSRFYVIPTHKLKQMIKDELYHRKVVGGDPGSESKNYLFRLEELEKRATLVHTM